MCGYLRRARHGDGSKRRLEPRGNERRRRPFGLEAYRIERRRWIERKRRRRGRLRWYIDLQEREQIRRRSTSRSGRACLFFVARINHVRMIEQRRPTHVLLLLLFLVALHVVDFVFILNCARSSMSGCLRIDERLSGSSVKHGERIELGE